MHQGTGKPDRYLLGDFLPQDPPCFIVQENRYFSIGLRSIVGWDKGTRPRLSHTGSYGPVFPLDNEFFDHLLNIGLVSAVHILCS